jgi:formate/nitrite transporter FocA (FNT family)
MSETAEAEAPAAGQHSPHLEEHERDQAARVQLAGARVIHEVLREEGETELRRSVGALAWSGLAAGLSMGFSFLTLGLLHVALEGTSAAEVVAPVGYSVGFVICVLGKQQLFTETTLTATLPLMHAPTAAGFGRLARMWAVVLAANLIGTFAFAWLISQDGVMRPDVANALLKTAKGAFTETFITGAVRAMFSGWLIALMVWLMPASGAAAAFVIVALTYVVSLSGFPHIIAGSTEAAYAVLNGAASVGDYGWRFLAPTLLGNVVGGTALAALLNHAPVAHDFAANDQKAEKKRR